MLLQTRLLETRPAADKGSWDGLESLSRKILVKIFDFSKYYSLNFVSSCATSGHSLFAKLLKGANCLKCLWGLC